MRQVLGRMQGLFRKEIGSFFSSLVGYLVIGVFLVLTSLCVWVFPSELNVLDAGYGQLDSLFYIAPWVFLFLVPAITMRLIAEERRTGTMELLLTRPVGELGIVGAKFLAAWVLVVLSLLPCLVYFYSIWELAVPKGNIDVGAGIGSMFGLVLLGGVYVSVGLFTSSVTDNQIVAFVLGVVGCLVFYEGFEAVASMVSSAGLQTFISGLGIKAHYVSISRGVIDMQDIFYFVGVIGLFLWLTVVRIRRGR